VSWSLICLDLDGVIADSSLAIPRTINRALVSMGLPEQRERSLLHFIGPPLLPSFGALLVELGEDPDLAWPCVQAYRQLYADEAARSTRLYPGMGPVLDQLAESAPLVVVTSKPTRFAWPILADMRVLGQFHAVFAPPLEETSEPKQRTLERALASMRKRGIGVGPVVMVGDRAHDVRAGRAAGVTTVGVLWGFGSRPELEGAGADHIVQRPDDLAAVLIAGGVAARRS